MNKLAVPLAAITREGVSIDVVVSESGDNLTIDDPSVATKTVAIDQLHPVANEHAFA